MKHTQRRKNYYSKGRLCSRCGVRLTNYCKTGLCRKCLTLSKREPYLSKRCETCGGPLKPQPPSKYKIRRFCSRTCAECDPEKRAMMLKIITKHGHWNEHLSERQRLMNRKEYKYWKKAVLTRDRSCVLCGVETGLEADHIIPLVDSPEKAFDVENGRALCKRCHSKTWTFGNPNRKKFKTSARLSEHLDLGNDVHRITLTLPRTEYELGLFMKAFAEKVFEVEVSNVKND